MEEIIKLISTYGLSVVISGLVLFFAVKLGNALFDDYKKKRAEKTEDTLAEARNHVSTTIMAILERTLLRAHCDRAYVFEFHNGTTSMGGLPFMKMTNTYEALGEGARSEMAGRENMPMQMYTTFINSITTNNCIIMDTRNRTDVATGFEYETLVARGVAVSVRAKIKDINMRVVGYFGIDYCQDKPVDDAVVEASIGLVQGAANEIGALLTVNKKAA